MKQGILSNKLKDFTTLHAGNGYKADPITLAESGTSTITFVQKSSGTKGGQWGNTLQQIYRILLALAAASFTAVVTDMGLGMGPCSQGLYGRIAAAAGQPVVLYYGLWSEYHQLFLTMLEASERECKLPPFC